LDDQHKKLYCTIFIDTEQDEDSTTKLIAHFLKGHINGINIESDYIDLSVIQNDERDLVKKLDQDEGFLFFSMYLEVSPTDEKQEQPYKQMVKKLVLFLRQQGFKAIPSCDFEDELNDGKNYKEFMK
jgi:hypothetical protein